MENTLFWLQEMQDNNESWVKISSVITMLKKEQEEAINYSQCCKSDSEQLVCDVDYLGNFTKGAKYLCKPDGLKHFEVEDDFGVLYKLHRKLFKKTE